MTHAAPVFPLAPSQDVYEYAFLFSRDRGVKCVALDVAVPTWRLLLGDVLKWRFTPQWCAFVEAKHGRAVSKDTWVSLLDFIRASQGCLVKGELWRRGLWGRVAHCATPPSSLRPGTAPRFFPIHPPCPPHPYLQAHKPDLSDFDPAESAWPTLIDEFVDALRAGSLPADDAADGDGGVILVE